MHSISLVNWFPVILGTSSRVARVGLEMLEFNDLFTTLLFLYTMLYYAAFSISILVQHSKLWLISILCLVLLCCM